MTSKEIREKFLSFFKERGHVIVQSSSLIPSDPSVLLTTAGMQRFKPYFTGEADPEKDFGTRRTCSIQKSFRTSDIESVGDESHLTFFEMLGNFSFGPVGSDDPKDFGKSGYFKRSAIFWAHEFITKELGLEIDYVSIFGGGKNKNGSEIPYDEESEKIWQELGIKDFHTAGMEDNFWGPTGTEGPCGPTTEIYVNGIEIWNIVFNEYYCDSKGNLAKLKNPGVDTGMGLERLAMVLQDKNNVFETDLFEPLVQKIKNQKSKIKSTDQNSKIDIDEEKPIRIIADHIKASVFLIADRIEPSNVGRGYILRRLLRRVMLHSRLLFKTKQYPAFIDFFINEIVEIYKQFYPELENQKSKIQKTIAKEEDAFYGTLEKGFKEVLKIFDDVELFIEEPKKIETRDFGDYKGLGKKFFDISSTYGFPIELIIEEINDRKKELGFGQLSKIQENEIKQEFNQEFKKHQEISRAGAEKKFGGHGIEKSKVKSQKSKLIRLHTATHLLQAALKKILGPEIMQKGSDITEERTRFDFSFPRKVLPDELKKTEEFVNSVIKKDLPVIMEEMTFEEAVRKNAYYAPNFNYPSKVKVYSIIDSSAGKKVVYSREICGGPHVKNTGEVGKFRITKEESVSEGVRRIRAVIE